jgi:8-hydroxy-5-deazaflavin:NADPH oxidoreductase
MENKMSIAILGTGNMGKALAKRLAGKAEVVIGSRSGTSYADAIKGADIVVLAIPYAGALEAAGTLDLKGKVVVDMSNPITPDFSDLLFGHTTSAAEEIAKVATGARVVKAFNTIFAALLDAPVAATAKIPVFIAGDDAAAVAAVADLTEKAGFAADPVGGLAVSRLIEPLGLLNIRLGYGLGRGTSIAPAWLKL